MGGADSMDLCQVGEFESSLYFFLKKNIVCGDEKTTPIFFVIDQIYGIGFIWIFYGALLATINNSYK